MSYTGKIKKQPLTLRIEVKNQINATRYEKIDPQSTLNHLLEKHEYGVYEKTTTSLILWLNCSQVTKVTPIKTLKDIKNQVAISKTQRNSQRIPSKQNRVCWAKPPHKGW